MNDDILYSEENILERCVTDCERTVIIHALRRTNGDMTDAAKILGTSKRILSAKIQKYDIDCAQYQAKTFQDK